MKKMVERDVAPSSKTMQSYRGQPIYSNSPGSPHAETDPAFSAPIAPRSDESMRDKMPLEHNEVRKVSNNG